jgi:hypothetical protein
MGQNLFVGIGRGYGPFCSWGSNPQGWTFSALPAAGSGGGFTIRQRQSDGPHYLVVTDPCHESFAGEISEKISNLLMVKREKYANISQVSDVSGPIP